MAGESAAFLSGRLQNRRKPYRFFSYYGSKNGTASKYPPPYWDTIIEPFAGAAGYSTLHYKRNVVLFDIDPIIVGVWSYLIRVRPNEILSLPLVASWDDEALNPFPQEARWLVGFWLAMGQPKPFNRLTSFAATRARSAWSEEIRFKLARQVDLIKHWQCYLCSYENIDSHYAFPGVATWFVDPPYQKRGGGLYRFGSSGIDYEHLGEWCLSRSGQVIVCEGADADWLPFDFHHFGHTNNTTAGHGHNRELMYHQFNGKKV